MQAPPDPPGILLDDYPGGDPKKGIEDVIEWQHSCLEAMIQHSIDHGGLSEDARRTIKLRLEEWTAGYEALRVVLALLVPSDHFEVHSVIASIRVSLSPSISRSSSFYHALCETPVNVLPAFDDCLAQFRTLTAILDHLKGWFPRHTYLGRIPFDISARAWEESLASTSGLSLFSKRRWNLLLVLMSVTLKVEFAGTVYPATLQQAIQLFSQDPPLHAHTNGHSAFTAVRRHHERAEYFWD
ncbi:uncharacterized protein JCM6883_000349 [Sporobolomyces salmoneus]|uniref:uncharacterized protein n=1 Tax=Sporobolomyces salmoneus TaxID=183962 RepID=UPI0031811AFA